MPKDGTWEMHRKITYNNADYHLNYLNLRVHDTSTQNLCGGRFENYINKNFGIKILPYNIKLIDLVIEKDNTDDLFVSLPPDYFLKWTDYPYSSRQQAKFDDQELELANFYDINFRDTGNDQCLSKYLHDYDTDLSLKFCEHFKTKHPESLKIIKHSSNKSIRPYECYMAYWRAYVIFETVQQTKFINQYLSPEVGVDIFKKTFIENNDFWMKKYSSTFKRIGTFRSFITRIEFSENKSGKNKAEISEFLLTHCHSSLQDLELDMRLLLEIHKKWEREDKNSGLSGYLLAKNLIRDDIYFLFEWLCYSGCKEVDLINKWSSNDRQSLKHSELKEVLNFEEFKFSSSFIKFAPYYWEDNSPYLDGDEIQKTFDYLIKLNSFNPWIRSFDDLHSSINEKDNVSLKQNRILDNLLVMTIRTEIVIREMYKSAINQTIPHNLNDIFKDIGNKVEGPNIFNLLSCRENTSKTQLGKMPDDIFLAIETCKADKSWNENQLYFFKKILCFITSRNYFAHHSYKDNELNDHTHSLVSKIFTACLHSIMYIAHEVEKNENRL